MVSKDCIQRNIRVFLAQRVVFFYYLSEKNEIEYLQLLLPYLDNNLLENCSWKTSGPNGLGKSLSFLYPSNDNDCYD